MSRRKIKPGYTVGYVFPLNLQIYRQIAGFQQFLFWALLIRQIAVFRQTAMLVRSPKTSNYSIEVQNRFFATKSATKFQSNHTVVVQYALTWSEIRSQKVT